MGSFQIHQKHHNRKFDGGRGDVVGFSLPNICYQMLPGVGVLRRDGPACKSTYCRHMRTCVCTVSWPGKAGLDCMPVIPVLGM